MALIIKDRVKEITTTTGTGAVSLGGASATFDAFQSVMSNGDTTFYAIVHTASGTDEWEVGLGTWNTGNTLTRTTVYAGSNGTSAVNFSSGNKDIFMTYPASKAAVAGEDVTFADVTATDITSTGTVTLSADPSSSLQAATKQYVDTIAAAGIHYHTPVRVEHPSNLNATYNNGSSGVGATLTNAGTNAALVLDNVNMALNDRVLVANQTDQTQNGVYTVTTVGDGSTAWVLTRSTDTDTAGPSDPDAFGKGDAFFIKEGDTNAGHLDVLTTTGTIVFGTTNIVFSEVAETSIYSAGTGLTLTGTTFSTNQDISTSASPTFAGGTFTGNVDLGDDDYIRLGDSQDLQIYHNASHSVIKDAGTGNLNLLADNFRIANAGWSKWYFIANNGGAATVFWNGQARLATSSGGIDVTGNITVSGSVDGRDVATDGTKLDGIETGATGDQTASEILTAIKTVDGAASGLDADLLDGQQGSYYLNTSTTFSGDVSGTYNNIVVANDSHTHDGRYYTETEADSRFVNVTGDSMTGALTIATTGVAASPSLAIDVSSSSAFVHSQENLAANLASTQTNILVIGKEGSTKNSGYLGFNWSSAGSNSNYVSLGHWGNDNLFRVYGDGTLKAGASNVIFHDGYHPNADKWTTARTLSLSGDASGSVSWDGSGNATLSVTVADNSHNHDYVPERNRTDWNDSTVISDVIGQLAWKNYGNNHTIFDASAGTSPDGTSVGNTDPSVGWVATYPTLMGWNGTYTYGVRVDSSRYADRWKTARTLSLSGDASGSVSWDGSANATLSVTVANDSHTHDGRYYTESEADSRFANVTGDTFTGHVNVTHNTSATGSSAPSYSSANIELQTSSNYAPAISFHRGGYSAGVLYEYDGEIYSKAWVTKGQDGKLLSTGNIGSYAWTSSNDGSGSGLDADLLDGYHLSTTRNAANTVPVRDGNGYLQLGWINTTSGATTSIDKIYASADNYIRYVTPATFRSQVTDGYYLGASSKAADSNLLDGIDSSSFLRSDVEDSGVGINLNGGTLQQGNDATLYVTASGNQDWGIKIGATSGKTEYGQVIEMPSSFNYAFRVLKNGAEHFNINSTGATIAGNYIWHAGNDGSGSGLDADLWDGNQFSSYLNQDVKSTANPRFASIYIDNQITHTGDTDNYHMFGTDSQWFGTNNVDRIVIDANGVRLGDTGNGYFRPVSGQYGSIEIDGGAHTGWEGYSIGGRVVFMHDNDNEIGLYDDVNNHWKFYGILGGATYMGYGSVYNKLETTSSGVTVNGDLNSTSDIRYKKNIETIDSALEKVQSLRGVTFDWDHEDFNSDSRATGVIAQDVEKVLPEAVRENEDGFKNVAYGNMVGLLIEAIKEQQEQIDALKKQLNG